MKNTIKILIAGLLFSVFLLPVNGQNSSNDEKLIQARLLLYEYKDASFPGDLNSGSYDPSWEGIFGGCFDSGSRKIVFDVPFSTPKGLNGTESKIDGIFGELVTVDEYIKIIGNALNQYKITSFNYHFDVIGFDTTNLYLSNTMQFEVRKVFDNTTWSLANSRNYIIRMQFTGGKPKITAIRLSDEDITRTNVKLTFVNSNLDQNDKEYRLRGIVSKIRIASDQTFNIREVTAETDTSGMIDLGLIANRALLKIDTVIDFNGNKFFLQDDWHKVGKKVNNQPAQGFIVPLRQSKWNGFSWSVRGFGGIIGQSKNQLNNFSSGSDFDLKTGYKYGVGLEMVKHFTFSRLFKTFYDSATTTDARKLTSRRNMYLGVGMGLSYYQFRYKITTDAFAQNAYDYSDKWGTPVQILISGSAYEETTTSNGIVLPVFVEFRKVLPNKNQHLQAFSFQTGLNFIIPFETKYSISGRFSRYGLYEQFNPKPVTNDPFYNYYSQSPLTINDTYQKNHISSALMFRLNGYFDIFGKKSDNLLDVGLLVSFPFKSVSSSETDKFYFSTGNDNFDSMGNSKNKIYNYFVGLSFGYNFIKYRLY